MKKITGIFLALLLLLSASACVKNEEEITTQTTVPETVPHTHALTTEIIASGDNDGISWAIYADGRLEIEGNGECDVSWGLYANVIKKVIFGEGITSIGAGSFENCKILTELVLPQSMQIIESRAFAGCAVRKLEVGVNLHTLAGDAFIGCELDNIRIASANPYLSTDQYGVIFNKDKTRLILYSNGFRMNTYSVPSSVTVIGERAFEGNMYLATLQLSESLTEIETNAFKDCENLRKVVFPKGFYRIGVRAFSGCRALNDVRFNEEFKIIGEYAFEGCVNLTKLRFLKGIEIIGSGAFDETLTEIYFEGSVQRWETVSKGDKPAFAANSINFEE